MEDCSSDFVNNLYTEYSPGVAIITIDNRILSLNLSDLCNKISLCNIIDNSAAKNSIKKADCTRKMNLLCLCYGAQTKCIHHSRTGIFLTSSSSFIETRAFKVNHSNEN